MNRPKKNIGLKWKKLQITKSPTKPGKAFKVIL